MKNSYFKYSALGMQMVVTIGLFVFLGRWLDKLLGFEKPWFTLCLALVASLGMIVLLIKKVK